MLQYTLEQLSMALRQIYDKAEETERNHDCLASHNDLSDLHEL